MSSPDSEIVETRGYEPLRCRAARQRISSNLQVSAWMEAPIVARRGTARKPTGGMKPAIQKPCLNSPISIELTTFSDSTVKNSRVILPRGVGRSSCSENVSLSGDVMRPVSERWRATGTPPMSVVNFIGKAFQSKNLAIKCTTQML